MSRTFVVASALQPQAAARLAAELPVRTDLLVTSPTDLAREAAAIAVDGRWVFTVNEPLLAPRVPGESGADVLARLASALHGLRAYDCAAPLVICDGLDILGAGVFRFDEDRVLRWANVVQRLLPVS